MGKSVRLSGFRSALFGVVFAGLLPIGQSAADLDFRNAPAPASRTHIVTVNSDGSFAPAQIEIFGGDTVEWRFSKRSDTIIPVNLDAGGRPDCTNFKPFDPHDPNEFTGPPPRAAAGVFTISPEEFPYASQDATWQSSNIAGIFIRPRWDDVHRGPGQFRWNEVDAEMDKAVRNGKVFSIGFKAGVKGTPQWIFDPGRTDAVVTKLDFGFKQDGRPVYYGSPADANYRKHYFDVLRAFAAHLRENNARYRALAYIKPSGANLYTHENRLPNETTQDLATWAGPGKYTPTALYEFYQQQEELLAAEFPDKEMNYALIQDGFPKVNDFGEYEGQSTPVQHPLPKGSEQTERILNLGRTQFGTRFVVAHNGLQRKPNFCPGSGAHPIGIDPDFKYVGSGCPNRWVLEQSERGQVTGFQTTNDLQGEDDVDSALQNAWDNSDAIYVELYEGNALQVAGKVLPSGNTLADWNGKFQDRRRSMFPTIADPYPLNFTHTFTSNSGRAAELHYVNGTFCASGASSAYGTIVILPALSFTAISVDGGLLRVTLSSAKSGTARVEYSDDLVAWKLLGTRAVSSGKVEFSDPSAPAAARFYRAVVE